MKVLKIAFFLFLIAFSSNAQNGQTSNSESKNSYIKLSLWPIADPYAPRLRFGYIQHISPHWKAGLDVGIGAKSLSFLTTEANIGTEYSLWEVRPELYYIFNPEAKILKYLSVEAFYIEQDHVFENGEYTSESNQDLRYDRGDFNRKKYGMHFKFGLFLNIGKRVGFNFFGGIGFRVADKQYSNVLNERAGDIFREWFEDPYEVEGKSFRVNPSLGIKFYYKL